MNAAIVSVVLKDFCKPFLSELQKYYPTPYEKLQAVRNSAHDADNNEILVMLDWIEQKSLTETFFPKE